MRHVVITGGAGFIGSHLCDAFLERGYAVTAIDNLITGRKENLTNAFKSDRLFYLEADISEPIDRSKLPFLKKFGLTGVLHFACPASPIDFERLPFQILDVDSKGTAQTVQLALDFQARYLIASTSEVYGDPLVHPQKESYWGNVNPIGPRACYDEAKRFSEAYVSTAIRHKGLNGGIIRIFNTYGPRMRLDDGRVVPELCRQALFHEPLTLHGDGKQTRSFCFVSDLVEGIIRTFESSLKAPINLGNPREQSILEFAEIVQKISGSTASLQFLPARLDDPRKRCPDISLAQQLLNWTAKVSLEEGLTLTLDSFKNQINSQSSPHENRTRS